MKKIILFLCLIFSGLIYGEKAFALESKGIKNNVIDEKYGGKGENIIKGVGSRSIPLKWTNPPKGTKSFAVIMEDRDAIPVTGFTWIHWSVADIDGEKRELEENESRTNTNLIQGLNSWVSSMGGFTHEEAAFYGGPMPPDKDHKYRFVIYALDKKLNLKNGYYLNELYEKMEGHILGESVLEGVYRK
jgi:Raf kinase inhibitor-like YbhB/YbcL family protein